MRVRFTRKPDGHHRLTVVRDDGTSSQGPLVPGLGARAIPHDMLHALVEKTLGLGRGVYGRVNEGAPLPELLDAEQRKADRAAYADPLRAELMQSEIVTALLQAETAYVGIDPEDFRRRLEEECAQHGLSLPAVSDAQLDALRALRSEYEQRWRDLPPGETLEIAMG